MDKNEISIAAVTILSGASAAMGPVGIPAFIAAATLGVVLASYGNKEDERPPVTEEQVKNLIMAHFAEHAAKSAWAKIESSYHYYQDYVNRAKSSEIFSPRDLSQIDQAILDAIGPNSNLQEGLALLYREDNPHDYEYVQHNLPIYMLGASVHVQYRLLDLARQKLSGEHIVPYQWKSIADLVATYENNIRNIGRYVKTMTIELILHEEISQGDLKIGSQELRDRSEALHQHYLGSDKDYMKYMYDLQSVHKRLIESFSLKEEQQ